MSKKKKTVTAPLSYDPGKGRPKEYLAYLNWQEMQALRRLNGNNMERGPMGLPSFPPDWKGSDTSTGNWSGAGGSTTGAGTGGGSDSGGSVGGTESGTTSSAASNAAAAAAAASEQTSSDAAAQQAAAQQSAAEAARNAAVREDAAKGGIASINVGPMQTPVQLGGGQIFGSLSSMAQQVTAPAAPVGGRLISELGEKYNLQSFSPQRYSAAKNLLSQPSPSGSLSSYDPTVREQVADYMSRTFYGDDRAGVERAKNIMNAAENILTSAPVGEALVASATAGRVLGSIANTASGIVSKFGASKRISDAEKMAQDLSRLQAQIDAQRIGSRPPGLDVDFKKIVQNESLANARARNAPVPGERIYSSIERGIDRALEAFGLDPTDPVSRAKASSMFGGMSEFANQAFSLPSAYAGEPEAVSGSGYPSSSPNVGGIGAFPSDSYPTMPGGGGMGRYNARRGSSALAVGAASGIDALGNVAQGSIYGTSPDQARRMDSLQSDMDRYNLSRQSFTKIQDRLPSYNYSEPIGPSAPNPSVIGDQDLAERLAEMNRLEAMPDWQFDENRYSWLKSPPDFYTPKPPSASTVFNKYDALSAYKAPYGPELAAARGSLVEQQLLAENQPQVERSPTEQARINSLREQYSLYGEGLNTISPPPRIDDLYRPSQFETEVAYTPYRPTMAAGTFTSPYNAASPITLSEQQKIDRQYQYLNAGMDDYASLSADPEASQRLSDVYASYGLGDAVSGTQLAGDTVPRDEFGNPIGTETPGIDSLADEFGQPVNPDDFIGPTQVTQEVQDIMKDQERKNRRGIDVIQRGPFVGPIASAGEALQKIFTGKDIADYGTDLKNRYMQAGPAERAALRNKYPDMRRFAVSIGDIPPNTGTQVASSGASNIGPEPGGKGNDFGSYVQEASYTPPAGPASAAEETGRPAQYYLWDLGVGIPSPGDPDYNEYQKYRRNRGSSTDV